GRLQGEGQRDRPPPAPQVEQVARRRRLGHPVEQHRGALVEAAGREDARRHLDVHVPPREADGADAALVVRGGLGGEVVVGGHRRIVGACHRLAHRAEADHGDGCAVHRPPPTGASAVRTLSKILANPSEPCPAAIWRLINAWTAASGAGFTPCSSLARTRWERSEKSRLCWPGTV